MAKHVVKCKYCGIQFDTNKEEFEKISNRYAHKKCFDERPQEDKDEEDYYQYAREMFGDMYDSTKTYMLSEKYIKDKKKNFNYGGMLKTLKYINEIKHMPIIDSKGSIGIIPYMYKEANDYYNILSKVMEENKTKKIDIIKVEDREVIINYPRLNGIKKMKFFNLEDEE